MKIMALCGSGLGSSFMVELNIKNVLKDLGVTDAEVGHTSVAQANPDQADLFVIGVDLAQSLPAYNILVVLNNLMDKFELKEKLSLHLKGE
ncbi:MAG: PTS sugar transporter subunit IIB [Bacilli bacterium]